MFKRLGAAILLVEDLQKSISFYRDTLELKIKNFFAFLLSFDAFAL